MLDALCSGKLISNPELKKSAKGTTYAHFMLTVMTGDEPAIITGVAFNDEAEQIAKLNKGDALSVTGSLKQTRWTDKSTGAIKHGLSITVSKSLSVYSINKRRATEPDEYQRN